MGQLNVGGTPTRMHGAGIGTRFRQDLVKKETSSHCEHCYLVGAVGL